MPMPTGPLSGSPSLQRTDPASADASRPGGLGEPGSHSHPPLTGGDNSDQTNPIQPTIAELVNAVFSRFDADADGNITLDEMLSALDPTGKTQSLVTQIASGASAVDSNADGSLSKDELGAVVSLQALQADTSSSKPAASRDNSGERRHGNGHAGDSDDADAGHDTSDSTNTDATGLSLSELLGFSDSATIDFTALATNVFTLVDANADSVLTSSEVTAALTRLDSNQDGVLDHADQPLDHFDQASIELIGLWAHALDPHGGPGHGIGG